MSLAQNIAVAATGCDDRATEAFVAEALKAHPQYAAVAAHWRAADDRLQEALASQLGWCEPTKERPPVNAGIMAAYHAVCEFGYEAIGEPIG